MSKAAKNPLSIAPSLLPLARMIDRVHPDPNNANDHPAESIAAIKASLQRFGQLKPIVVDGTGMILAGHGTWLAAKELGATVLAVVDLPRELRDRAEEFALADNQSGRLSAWNPAKLKEALERIAGAGTVPTDLGFNERDLQALLAKIKPPKTEGANNWDTAAGAKRRTKPGELWSLGKHRLLVADCHDAKAVHRMMGTRKAQCVFTDPPYGVDYEDSKGRKIQNDKLGRDTLAGFLTKAFKVAVEASTSDAAFYIWHADKTRADFEHALKAAGLKERQYLIWSKPSFTLGWQHYQQSHEPCFYASKAGVTPAFYAGRAETTLWRFAAQAADDTATTLGPGLIISDGAGNEIMVSKPAAGKKTRHLRLEKGKPLLIAGTDGQTTVWEVARDTQHLVHPNQKPVELAGRAIANSTQPGQAVLDLFGGSGSTLMAAEEHGRTAYLVEKDPRWADQILARFEKATKTKATKE